MELQPIVKWAGGKRWLIRSASELLPTDFNRYIEPFLGGGAVYFHLKPEQALLTDINHHLINVYNAIKTDWRLVVELMRDHQSRHSKEYYYHVRKHTEECSFKEAARMLYLNRTCWNGLYRVNVKGEFNVPIGTKDNILFDIESFEAVAELFSNAVFESCDFQQSIDAAQEGDFVFVDPPYTVKHNYNGFIQYNETLFKWDDQVRLAAAVDRATERGAKVLVLNANHASIVDLYSDHKQIVLSRNNVLSGKSEFRGKYQELAIRCWI